DDSGRGNLHIVLFGFKISASSLPLVLRYMSEIEKRMPFEYDAHDRPRFQHGMLTSSTTIKPILLLALGVTMFGVMDGLGKVLTSDYSLAQIVWGRYAFALPVVLSMRRPGAWPDFLICKRPGLQAGRGLLPLLASMAVILGLRTLPLADFTAISFASPL